jgi:hypothetical protein
MKIDESNRFYYHLKEILKYFFNSLVWFLFIGFYETSDLFINLSYSNIIGLTFFLNILYHYALIRRQLASNVPYLSCLFLFITVHLTMFFGALLSFSLYTSLTNIYLNICIHIGSSFILYFFYFFYYKAIF